MITTPFGMKECIEHNTESVAAMHVNTRIIELMYDIFPSWPGADATEVKDGSARG